MVEGDVGLAVGDRPLALSEPRGGFIIARRRSTPGTCQYELDDPTLSFDVPIRVPRPGE